MLMRTLHDRKKRCNQAYPVCGHCSRLNLLCRWEEPRETAPAASDAALNIVADKPSANQMTPASVTSIPVLGNTTLLEPMGLQVLETELDCSPGGTELLPSRRAMMRYYTASFALMLTTNVENNCFLSGECVHILFCAWDPHD